MTSLIVKLILKKQAFRSLYSYLVAWKSPDGGAASGDLLITTF